MQILSLASTFKLERVNVYSIPSVGLRLLQLLNTHMTSHLRYKQTFKLEKKTVWKRLCENLQTDWNSINGSISRKVTSYPIVTTFELEFVDD